MNKTQLYYPSPGLAHCRTARPPLATSLSYDRPQKWRATIHSKSKSPSARDFEFSTKRKAENAIKFALFAELILPFPPMNVQALLKSWITNLTLTMVSKNALVTQNSWNINDLRTLS